MAPRIVSLSARRVAGPATDRRRKTAVRRPLTADYCQRAFAPPDKCVVGLGACGGVWQAKSSDYTKVSFRPDLAKFGMSALSDDIVALFTKRVFDMAGVTQPDVRVGPASLVRRPSIPRPQPALCPCAAASEPLI